MDFGLTGKVAIVAAANKGLGRASALTLAQEGAQVVIAARSREVLEQAAEEIRQKSGQPVLGVPTDLQQPEAVMALVEKTISAFGGIDLLLFPSLLSQFPRSQPAPLLPISSVLINSSHSFSLSHFSEPGNDR